MMFDLEVKPIKQNSQRHPTSWVGTWPGNVGVSDKQSSILAQRNVGIN